MQPQLSDTGARRNGATSVSQFRHESPFNILRRRKWLAVVVMATVLTAVVAIVISLPNIYEAMATVQVEQPQIPESFVRSTVTSELASRLKKLNQQILSPARLAGLIEQFNLYPDVREETSLDAAVALMEADIEVLPQNTPRSRHSRKTTAFTLSYRGAEPQKVADVTNTLVSFYIEENMKVRAHQATGTTQFLQEQLVKQRHQLEQQEQQLSQFKEQYIGELPEQLPANLAALERVNAQLRLTSDELTRVNERYTNLKTYLANEQHQTLPRPTIPFITNNKDPVATQLAGMYRELAALRTQYSDKYPDVARLKAEIATLEQHFSSNRPVQTETVQGSHTAAASPHFLELKRTISDVEGEIKALRADERKLLVSIAQYQRRVDNTPRREQELQGLLRDYETTQELYRSLLRQQGEAKLAASLEQHQQSEKFSLLEPATPPAVPASPQRMQLILGGLILSLLAAVGMVFFVDKRDGSFHVVEDLQAFASVPVLVSLPCIETARDRRRKWGRFSLATVGTLVFLGLVAISAHTITTGELPSFSLPLGAWSLDVHLPDFLSF